MSEIKERPVLFSTEMVKAILREDSPKTQTRRVIKFPKSVKFPEELEVAYPDGCGNWVFWEHDEPGLAEFTKLAYPNGEGIPCPYGKPGDHLWVRESWTAIGFAAGLPISEMNKAYGDNIVYKANVDKPVYYDWKPSIHMPRWASRTNLEVTNVRVQRIQDISLGDIRAEGFDPLPTVNPYGDFAQLWDSINLKRGYSWKMNPWVWVLDFKRLPTAIEQMKELRITK